MPRKFVLSVFVLFLSSLATPQAPPSKQTPQVRRQDLLLNLASPRASVERTGQTTTLFTEEIAVPLATPTPFLAVALRLEGVTEPLTIYYRSAQDAPWGEWEPVTIDRDVAPQGSNYLSALLFLDKQTSHLQFKLEFVTAAALSVPAISTFKVSFISPGDSSESKPDTPHPSISGSQFTPESSTAKYPKPIVSTRTQWGCPDGQGNPRGAPSYTTVTHLLVHHTVNSNSATDWTAVVRSIWSFHIFTNGWSDLGYNYLIDPNGVIYEGRGGGDNVLGAHFSCQNGGTMGVAMLGTFTSVKPTEAALNSLREILSWKADQRDLDPLATSFHTGMQTSLQNISGHRDGNNLARSCTVTECPGEMLYPLMPNLRVEVKNLVAPTNDFLLTSAASKQVIFQGGTVTFPISSSTLSGTPQSVNLSTRNVPAGVSASFLSPTLVTGNATQLAMTVPASLPSGNYTMTVIANGTTKRALDLTVTVTGKVETVSAATYTPAAPVALESIASAFGVNLAATAKAAETSPLPTVLADVTVRVKDSLNTELLAPLFYVSPTQLNYQLPAGLAPGTATVTILHKTDIVAFGSLRLERIAPGLFTANANGQGVAAAQLQRRAADGTDSFEPVAVYDETQKLYFPRLLDLSDSTAQYFLTLYGTGLRFRNAAVPVTAQIGGTTVEVLYAGEQREFFGLDQVNLRLTPELAKRGQVEVRLTIEGQTTAPVVVSFR